MRRRCQRNSVSGVTSHPARLGRGSAAAIAPSKLRSASVSPGRSTCRRSTPSWWRNTMISRSFERPDRTVSRASDARNRYKIRYTRNQHRPASRQVNDHGRVSGTHSGPQLHRQARRLTRERLTVPQLADPPQRTHSPLRSEAPLWRVHHWRVASSGAEGGHPARSKLSCRRGSACGGRTGAPRSPRPCRPRVVGVCGAGRSCLAEPSSPSRRSARRRRLGPPAAGSRRHARLVLKGRRL